MIFHKDYSQFETQWIFTQLNTLFSQLISAGEEPLLHGEPTGEAEAAAE